MKETLSHDQVEQLLPAAALEILEGDELVEVTSHLEGCADCARLLDSYREVVATLGTSLPERPFDATRSSRIHARLLSRTGATDAGATGRVPRSSRLLVSVDRWAGWAVAAGMAGVLLVHHSVHRPVAYGWLVAGVLALLLLGLGVYLRIQRARVAKLEQQVRSLLQQRGSRKDSSAEGSGSSAEEG
jgi:anti-sigma-K factor RskA